MITLNYDNQSGMAPLMIMALIAALGVGIVGTNLYLQKATSPETNVSPSAIKEAMRTTPAAITSPTVAAITGHISGHLIYPSSFIPPTMRVCAKNLATSALTCTDQKTDPKFSLNNGTGVGYDMDLPPGSYHVYAYLNQPGATQKAYYNDFVTCGLQYGCPSHAPIIVTIVGGENRTDVYPHDWYDTDNTTTLAPTMAPVVTTSTPTAAAPTLTSPPAATATVTPSPTVGFILINTPIPTSKFTIDPGVLQLIKSPTPTPKPWWLIPTIKIQFP